MRKTLLLMASAALLASCTTDLLEFDSYQASVAQGEGVIFAVPSASTRGMMAKVNIDGKDKIRSYFFAEQDRIDLWYQNAKLGSADANVKWTSGNATSKYKVTSMTGNPMFTAINDDNKLELVGIKEAKFFAAYPTGQKIAVTASGDDVKFVITPATTSSDALNLQTQNYSNFMNFDKRMMYAYATGHKDATGVGSHKAVADVLDLHFTTPLATALIKLQNMPMGLGKLKSIDLLSETSALVPAVKGQNIVCELSDVEASGDALYLLSSFETVHKTYKETGNYIAIPKGSSDYYSKSECEVKDGTYYLTSKSEKITDINTVVDPYTSIRQLKAGATTVKIGDVIANIDYNDTFTFDPKNPANIVKSDTPAGKSIVKKITLKFDSPIVPKNDDIYNLFVLPTEVENETFYATFHFENSDITLAYERPNKFVADGAGYLNFDFNQLNYIVTGTGSTKTLQINKGALSQVFVPGDATKVIWNSGVDKTVNASDIKYIKFAPTSASIDTKTEWAKLNNFSNVYSIEVLNNTSCVYSLPSGLVEFDAKFIEMVEEKAFNSCVGSLEVLNIPSVETIHNNQADFVKLTSLNISSYDFNSSSSAVKPSVFFNSNTKASLKNVNISSVKTLGSTFGVSNSISFQNYKELTDITLNANGTNILDDSFNGCNKLANVNGSVKMSLAKRAFMNCVNLQKVIVADETAIIPESAFASCGASLTGIKHLSVIDKKTGKDVVPYSVGKEAFKNSKIKNMNLRYATAIGTSAFENAALFEGTGAIKVVTLSIPEVYANTFAGTAVQRFQLSANTLRTNSKSLDSNSLEQIQFLTKVKPTAYVSDQCPTKKATVELFIYATADGSWFDGYLNRQYVGNEWEDDVIPGFSF